MVNPTQQQRKILIISPTPSSYDCHNIAINASCLAKYASYFASYIREGLTRGTNRKVMPFTFGIKGLDRVTRGPGCLVPRPSEIACLHESTNELSHLQLRYALENLGTPHNKHINETAIIIIA